MNPINANTMRNKARIRQTRLEVERVDKHIKKWLENRRAADKELKKHHTQLQVLESMLSAALAPLTQKIKDLSAGEPSGSVYATCYDVDLRLTWVQRVWLYYAEKFDQRDASQISEVLDAADEVVWSCYAPCFKTRNLKPPAAPLTYIEPMYSPHAIPRKNPPPEFRSSSLGPFQQQFLKELPIPIIGLPPICVESPWWLIFLAHEAGHHVQNDLVSGGALVNSFSDSVDQCVSNVAAGDVEKAERGLIWKNRSDEIFADMFSVACTGTAAVRAMAELETTVDSEMLKDDRPAYPPRLVRLAMLAETASAPNLKLNGLDALPEDVRQQIAQTPAASAPIYAAVKADLSLVRDVVHGIIQSTIVDQKTLPKLVAYNEVDFGATGNVRKWTAALQRDDDNRLPMTSNIYSARLLISSAVHAWAELVERLDHDPDDDVKRENLKKASDRFRKKLLDAIKDSREKGTRAGKLATVDSDDFARRFASSLNSIPLDDLKS